MAKVKIDDGLVEHVWICEECNILEFVHPDFYTESGNPVCTECDEEMEYSHTLVNLEE
jgi:hypothetical protein